MKIGYDVEVLEIDETLDECIHVVTYKPIVCIKKFWGWHRDEQPIAKAVVIRDKVVDRFIIREVRNFTDGEILEFWEDWMAGTNSMSSAICREYREIRQRVQKQKEDTNWKEKIKTMREGNKNIGHTHSF